jgi:hypothetical protein
MELLSKYRHCILFYFYGYLKILFMQTHAEITTTSTDRNGGRCYFGILKRIDTGRVQPVVVN